MNMEFTSVPKRRPQPTEAKPPVPAPEPQPTDDFSPPPSAPSPKPKSSKKWLMWTVVLLLLLGGSAFGWMWYKDKNKKPAQNQNTAQTTHQDMSETAAITCDEPLQAYESDDLGFGFCYPQEWGTPTVADAKLAPADTGSRFAISFPSKSQVKVAVISTDWSTAVARGGECYFPSNDTPDFASFSTAWEIEGEATAPNSVMRGIEKSDNEFLISEDAGEFFGGACVRGTVVLNTTAYPQAVATYFETFNGAVATPKAHMDSPTVLVPTTERTDFVNLIKSVKKI